MEYEVVGVCKGGRQLLRTVLTIPRQAGQRKRGTPASLRRLRRQSRETCMSGRIRIPRGQRRRKVLVIE